MPGLKLWRGLAPRRFLTECLLADVINATEVLPASQSSGIFAVITTCPLGLPETLPDGWTEIERLGDYFATYQALTGITAREVSETLALELIPLFYPSEVYEQKLCDWLQKELGPHPDGDQEGATTGGPGPDDSGPDPLGPDRILDIPPPSSYRNLRSEEEQDLDFLYGNGHTPPEYHGYGRECAAQLDPSYGPPEASDLDIQAMEEQAFYFG